MTFQGYSTCACGSGMWVSPFSDENSRERSEKDYDYGSLFDTAFSILIIDDEHLVTRMLTRVLRKFATDIYTAANPSEARSVLRNHSVNFVVCDFNLGPESPTGAELLEALREEFSGIEHAVIFSGEARDSIPPTKAADDVLQKDNDLEQLCNIVRRNARARRVYEL